MTYNAETRQKHYIDVNNRLRQSMKIVSIGRRYRVIGSQGKTLFTGATKSDCQTWINFNYPVSDNKDNISNSKESKAMKNQKPKMSDFLKAANTDPKLTAAVIRQFGGWQTFQEKAHDVANHGIDGGFCGFIYYDETNAFTKKHKKLIIENVKQLADDVGENFTKVIADFNCLKNSGITENDVMLALMSPRSCEEYIITQVYNALAWYAGETVAHEYADFVYNLENEEF